MKRQHVVALVVALVALLGLKLLLGRRGTTVATEAGEAGIVRLVPKDVDAENVRWIRVTPPPPEAPEGASAPAASETPKPLELRRDGDQWLVASAEGAPADQSQVKDFVRRVVDLAGEVRGEGESSFARFGVDAASATKVELGGEPGTALATIWIGKQGDDGDAHFARLEGSNEVRHVQQGLRGPLQLYGESAKLPADLWVDKVVAGVDPKDVAKLTVERADVTYVLERQAPPADAGASGPSGPSGPAATWRITAPEMPWVVQADSLDGVVSRSAKTRVASILPAGDGACAAPGQSGRARFAKADGGEVVVALAAQAAGREEVGLSVEGRPFCYGLGTWGVQQLLPRASQLWSIPQVFEAEAGGSEPTKVRYRRGGTTWTLAKSADGKWSLESPAKREADASRASRLVSGARNLRIDDVAEAARVPAEALAVEATISFEAAGKPVSVEVLGERPGGLGDRYVRFQGGTFLTPGYVAVISKTTADSLLPTGAELEAKAATTD